MSGTVFGCINLPRLVDERGELVVTEVGKNCPFLIARVYWVFNTGEGVSRGFHAHHKTRQMAVCVSGSCSFLMDDGTNRERIGLDTPDQALLIEAMVWHEMHDFSSDCVLLVLADAAYDEADYIRNFNDFQKFLKRT